MAQTQPDSSSFCGVAVVVGGGVQGLGVVAGGLVGARVGVVNCGLGRCASVFVLPGCVENAVRDLNEKQIHFRVQCMRRVVICAFSRNSPRNCFLG